MWNFLKTIDFFDIRYMLNSRREASMNTEGLVVNNSCNREIIKEICKVLPHIRVFIFSLTLSIKAIDLCYLAGLMITSYQSYSERVT